MVASVLPNLNRMALTEVKSNGSCTMRTYAFAPLTPQLWGEPDFILIQMYQFPGSAVALTPQLWGEPDFIPQNWGVGGLKCTISVQFFFTLTENRDFHSPAPPAPSASPA